MVAVHDIYGVKHLKWAFRAKMPLMRIAALLLFLALPLSAKEIASIVPLGQVTLPHLFNYDNTPVGGLSGLSYDAKTDTFVAISDDRSKKAPARYYVLKAEMDQGRLKKVELVAHHTLTVKGRAYGDGKIDAEGIALAGKRLFISSEGDAARGLPPFVGEYAASGELKRYLPLPGAFVPKGHFGIRNNLAFESLTASPDGHTLYTATESALVQDGPEATSRNTSGVRILSYNLKTGKAGAQYRYDIDKAPEGVFAMNGLADMEALDNQGHLLALERSFSVPDGFDIRLYQVSTQGATDIRAFTSQQGHPVVPVKKTLLASFTDLGVPLDNAEGLALGPKLKDGSQLLLMVADDNFSDLQQSWFWAFAVRFKP